MKQRELFIWLTEVKPPVLADASLVGRCRHSHDAILLTWNLRRVKYSQATAAAMLGMPASHLSNILSGQKYLPDDMRLPFMWLCGSLALRQWEDLEMERFGLDMELLEAERKLEEIKARRAA